MRRIITLLFFLFPLLITAQNSYYLYFNNEDTLSYNEKKVTKFDSKEKVSSYLKKTQGRQVKKGYVLASIDKIEWKNDTAYVDFYLGEQFNKINITFNEDDHYIIRKTPRISERLIAQLPFAPEMVEILLNDINKYLSNNGYPFSKVYLKIDKLQPNNSRAHLHIEKGPLVNIQKIHIKGGTKVKEKYIQNAISIKEGDSYNSEYIQRISQRIEQVQFINEIRPHEILFTPDGAELYLYLESAPVSSINGIVGLQPNPVTGKTTITGDIRLKLLNIIKHGEELQINWRSLQPKTQELKVDFDFPFLFNTPFGVEAKFILYKLDSTYLKTNLHFGVRYYFTGGSYMKAFYQGDNSNLLYGASSITNSNLATVNAHNYGLGFYRHYVNYIPNPSKGLNITADIAMGRRKSRIPESDSSSISTTLRGNLKLELFIPITHRHVIRIANFTQSYFAPKIYQNELFRFGGLITQRGFNEETLFATTLTTFSLEYRFLVDKNSHAFAFFDQSIYENNGSGYVQDTPFGFGVGYSFGTKLGIFSISYALGKQFDNPIQIRDGKVHFGYTAYF